MWGRTRLAPWFPDSETPVGEVWFLAERELPLLVKLIFTTERLSVQVHPDDGEDGPRGQDGDVAHPGGGAGRDASRWAFASRSRGSGCGRPRAAGKSRGS